MIRFIHTADIHFGMENYGRIDPTTGIHSRLHDFEKALTYCVDYGIKEKIDFFLFAGDAYKTPHPTPTHQRLLLGCLLKLHKAGIPIVMVVGNHDHPLSFGKAHALEIFGQLPLDGFIVFSKPGKITLQTKNGPVQIVGIPWPTRNTVTLTQQYLQAQDISEYISKGTGKIIAQLASELDPTLPTVLVGHLTVSNGIFSGSEKRAIHGSDPLLMPSQLAIPPFDYVALGHLHRFQELNHRQYPPIVYSGSVERIDFGERKEDKGFCMVSLNAKGDTQYEFIKTPTRPFIQIEVHLNGLQSQTDQIITAIHEHDITDAIIKIVYHVPAGAKDRVDITAIQKTCTKAWYIASIIPIRIPEKRERRLALKVDMELATLLANYFELKPDFKAKKEQLVQKALLLEAEIKQQEQ